MTGNEKFSLARMYAERLRGICAAEGLAASEVDAVAGVFSFVSHTASIPAIDRYEEIVSLLKGYAINVLSLRNEGAISGDKYLPADFWIGGGVVNHVHNARVLREINKMIKKLA